MGEVFFRGSPALAQLVVPAGGERQSSTVGGGQVAAGFRDDAARHDVPLRAPVQWPAW